MSSKAGSKSGGVATTEVASFDDGAFMDSPIMVAIKVRPMNAKEKATSAAADVVEVVSDTVVKLADDASTAQDDAREMTFDRVMPLSSTQPEMYEQTAKKVLSRVLAGYNACIFAYGQTGAGKSFTMFGPNGGTIGGPLEGIVPRLASDLFAQLAAMKAKRCVATVEATYVEVYREELRDLWDAGEGAPNVDTDGDGLADAVGTFSGAADEPRIRNLPNGTIQLDGATRQVVKSYEGLGKLLDVGGKRRVISATEMNATSSRSHAVLTLYITITDTDASDGVDSRAAKLHLIDLAGSERQQKTGATGEQLKEGAAINKSLSALGNVINALTAPKPEGGPATHIPYRDSKLTALLSDSLGRNAYTLLITCLSPSSTNYAETLASLRFAARAKLIKGVVTRNTTGVSAAEAALRSQVEQLTKQVEQLTKELASHAAPVSAAAAVPPGPSPAESALRAQLEQVTKERDQARSELAAAQRAAAAATAAPLGPAPAESALRTQLEQVTKERDQARSELAAAQRAAAAATAAAQAAQQQQQQQQLKRDIVFVVAPPAVGKGTQCARIKERFGFTHLSTGDLLREEVAKGSALGKQASAVMAAGGLVSDDLVLELLSGAIHAAPVGSSARFLIDGYPRSLPQAMAFEKKIGKPAFVLSFTASDDALLARALERGRTSGRSDDNAASFKSRLATFRTQSQAVLDHYSAAGLVRMVDANRPIDAVFADVLPLFAGRASGAAPLAAVRLSKQSKKSSCWSCFSSADVDDSVYAPVGRVAPTPTAHVTPAIHAPAPAQPRSDAVDVTHAAPASSVKPAASAAAPAAVVASGTKAPVPVMIKVSSKKK